MTPGLGSAAQTLGTEPRSRFELPVHIHTHDSPGSWPRMGRLGVPVRMRSTVRRQHPVPRVWGWPRLSSGFRPLAPVLRST
jgi:hypothetical protein